MLRRSLSSAPSRRGETRREELRAPVSWAFLPQALRDSSCGPQSVPFLLNSSLDHISYVTSIFFSFSSFVFLIIFLEVQESLISRSTCALNPAQDNFSHGMVWGCVFGAWAAVLGRNGQVAW